jgi:putative alpha-1,2-mannosidase
MGLFEMDGGCAVKPTYDLSSPLFDRIVIHLDPHYYSGKDFVIEAHHNSPPTSTSSPRGSTAGR